MRCMVMMKAADRDEAGVVPDERLLAEMARYNAQLARAGVLLAAEGLRPSAEGVRVRLSGATRTVIEGPFAEAGEPLIGFWLLQVRSLEEAIEWVRRCPDPHRGNTEIEIRPVFKAEEFGGPPRTGPRGCAASAPERGGRAAGDRRRR